jgi:hypothetical protein
MTLKRQDKIPKLLTQLSQGPKKKSKQGREQLNKSKEHQ